VIFRRSTTDVVFAEPLKCAFPGCEKYAAHDHHITYDPEVIKGLCARHHEEITILNGQHGRKNRSPLSNKYRWWIWYQWTQRKMKVRRTRKSVEWIEDWYAPLTKKVAGEAPTLREPHEVKVGKSIIEIPSERPVVRTKKKTPRTKRKRRKATKSEKASVRNGERKKSRRARSQ
jgi:hypothetical protein